MITGCAKKKVAHAKEYFSEHLVAGDYHSQGHQVTGDWFGKGVVRLGLDPAQPVRDSAFRRLCDNLHPLTAAPLTARMRQVNRRVFFDFVCSAPKSVSIMALTVGDDRIVEAHAAACREALRRLEERAATRIRKGGRQEEKVTGEIVAAVFRHDSSRALDPQLHDHFVIFNCTWDETEKRWKALDTGMICDSLSFLTEVYRSELAARLVGLGYRITNGRHGFEIEGVSQVLIDRFSKGRLAILNESERLEKQYGVKLSNKARATIARVIRAQKLKTISKEEVSALQRAQLTKQELAALEAIKPGEKPRTHVVVPPSLETTIKIPQLKKPKIAVADRQSAKEALDYAEAHLFERRTVVKQEVLLKVALVYGRGRITLADLQAELPGRHWLIHVDDELTTKEALKQEKQMIELVNKDMGQFRAFLHNHKAGKNLTDDQRLAVSTLLNSPDQVTALRGYAGAGKTRVLQEICLALRKGSGVSIFAPTASSVEVLRCAGHENAQTVQRFLVDEKLQKQARGHVWLIDEAGLLSNGQMLTLLELARANRSRIILCGDIGQHSSMEAGDALRILEQRSTLRTVRITNIQRQLDREYREAIAEMAAGRVQRGFHRLCAIGAVEETEDGYVQMAAEYVASIKHGKTAVVVCPTWEEIDVATGSIRGRLQHTNLLSTNESRVQAHRSLHWTLAQKRDLERYRTGLMVRFLKPTAEFQNREWARVVEKTKGHLVVEKTDGKRATLTKKQAGCFDVMKTVELSIASGEKLLIQANDSSLRLIKGQIATVEKVAPDGSIALEDGRSIPNYFRCYTHGYAITSFASQSRTVDHVYVFVDAQSQALTQKSFYVAASRGREKVRVFTQDREMLADALGKTGTRLSATELVESARAAHRETAKETRSAKVRMAA